MAASEAGDELTRDAPVTGLPEAGTVIADKYRVDRIIGRGGMGAVFQATHLVTDKVVALKCMLPRQELAPGNLDRFIREARAAGRVSHPNIVDIYDVGEHEGTFFLVMEYLRGRSLRELMQRGALPEGPLLRSLLPALRGVQAAHRRGVVHRDLKPENLFLCCDPDGEPLEAKVLDFGISKVGEQGGGMLSITRTGAVMGTPFYMSPEQAEDSSTVDERTDIYAIGVILYEALSGQLPYRAESLTALLLRITRGDALPLRRHKPELPAALESAVMRAMASDPHKRFADMRALIAALEPFAGTAPLSLTPSDPGLLAGAAHSVTPFGVESHPPRASRARALAIAGALGLGLLLIAGAALWRAGAGAPHAAAPAPVPVAAAKLSQPTPDRSSVPAPAPAPAPAPPAAAAVAPAAPAAAASVAASPSALGAPGAAVTAVDARPTTGSAAPRRKRAARAPHSPAGREPPDPAPKAASSGSATTEVGTPPPDRRPKGRLGIELQPDQF